MESDGGVAPMQPRELSEYACWRHPFRQSHIYMHPAQQHRVRAQILDSFESENPSEIGGLLLGRIILERAGMSIVIEDVEFVAGSGKYFNSSPADLAKLTSSLNGPPKRVDLTYIGYFRSHIREGLFLSAEDGEFAEGRLRHPDAIFLVVKPYDSGICMAGFFCWQNGVLEKEFSHLEALFGLPEKRKTDPAEPSDLILHQPDAATRSEQESTAAEVQTAVSPWKTGPAPAAQASLNNRDKPGPMDLSTLGRAGSAAPKAEMAKAAEPPLPLPPENPRKWGKIALQAGALVCVGAIAGCTSLLLLQKRVRIPPDHSASHRIGLHVDRAPSGRLDVTWNRDPAALGGVKGGKLSITGGVAPLELNLDSQQLRNGKLAYFPSRGDVQFRMEFFLNAGRSVSESIRAVTAGLPSEAWAGRRMGNARAARATDSRSSPLKPQRGPDLNFALKQSGAGRADAQDVGGIAALPLAMQPGAPKPQPIFRLTPEARRALAPQKALHTKPESLPKSTNASTEPVFAGFSAPSSLGVPIGKKSLHTNVARSSAVGTAAYVGPAVIRQIRPRIPASIAILVTSEQTVRIIADIDAEGKVTDAELTSNNGPTSALLGHAALDAVRQYRFRPASRNGLPVPSQSMISFRFKP